MSIVIPVRNEEKSLSSLIESLRRQTLSPAEVILVDGGSVDRTVALARRFAEEDERIQVIEAGNATPGRGRNVGIAAAAHEWVALTDAGITLEPTWLERLVRVVEDDPAVEVVYGNYEPIVNSQFERCAALAYPPPKQQRPGGWMRGPSVASMLLRRSVWQKVGGFPDLRAAEDLIFMNCVQQQNCKTSWAPTATVWWQMQPSLIRTFRKFVLYSKHNVWAGRQHDWHYGIARQYAVSFIFVVLALTHSRWWLLAMLLGFAARVAKSIWRRREARGLLWALNPIQFFGVGIILLTIDLATFVGWAQAIVIPRSIKSATQSTATK